MKGKPPVAKKVVRRTTVRVPAAENSPVTAKPAEAVLAEAENAPTISGVEPDTTPAPAPVITKSSPPASQKPSVAEPAPAAFSPEIKEMTVKVATIPTKPKAAVKEANSMITDFNDRAKAIFEKTTKAGEELSEFTKGNMEALAASAKTAAKGAESLGQEIADYGKKSFETASATMKTLATVKTPTEMFQIQSDYAKTAFDSAVAEASKFSEAWLKLAGDVFQPLSNRYAIAAEKIKGAAL